MKTVLAIIVYNRFANLQHWLHCWKQCRQDAELVVIHTGDDTESFFNLCRDNEVKYIHRKNQGFDIGAMQDVFAGRIQLGIPDWDLLLWCCDDTMPMSKDFVRPFIERMQDPHVGIACMQISKSVQPHVRTTGFMIRRSEAVRIKFPADPVTTKQQCYLFEHKGKDTLTNQVRAMWLDCVMLSNPRTSVMWDSAHPNARLRLDRQAEHDAVFNPERVPKPATVTFICTIYNSYPQIVSSLLLQTYQHWELILIHDGPSENGTATYIPNDPRIHYIETPVRVGKWGHIYRRDTLRDGNLGEFVVITNADNYTTRINIPALEPTRNYFPGSVTVYHRRAVGCDRSWFESFQHILNEYRWVVIIGVGYHYKLA